MWLAFGTCAAENSPCFLTSKIGISFSKASFNVCAETVCMVSISFPAFCHEAIPPTKNPSVLSKPTRDKRIITSSSLFSGATNKIGCFTSLIRAPTQGAKPPSIPINIELGIWPCMKSSWFLTSKIIAPVLLAKSSKS